MAKITFAGQSCFQISVSDVDIVINPLKKSSADVLINDFEIKGAGEYEVKGVFVQGIPSSQNIIYTIEAEEMRFCYLGDIGQAQLTDEQLEKIGAIDVLMVSVADEPQKIIGQIEPKIVIPMNYDNVSKFLKSMGKNSVVPQDKLSIKASALPTDSAMEVVVLTP